jgi:hypothetical protein
MSKLKVTISSFLSSFSSKKTVSTASLNKDEKRISKDKDIKEPSSENDLPSSTKEVNSIYYLPVHLM